MSTKTKIVTIIVLIVVAFAAGRYSISPPSQEAVTQSHETVQQDTHETIVRIKEPGGKTTTTVTKDITTKAEETKKSDIKVESQSRPRLNVSGLVGTDIHSLKPVYGVSVNKEFLGPITIGAYGLTSGMIGLSIGVNF